MPQALLAHEPVIRLGAFASVLIVVALWEALAPRRPQAIGRARRWPGNLGVVVIGTVLVRLVFPVTAVGTALLAESRGFSERRRRPCPSSRGCSTSLRCSIGTYRAQPAAGHERMTIGLEQFRDPRELRLDRMLLQPFREP